MSKYTLFLFTLLVLLTWLYWQQQDVMVATESQSLDVQTSPQLETEQPINRSKVELEQEVGQCAFPLLNRHSDIPFKLSVVANSIPEALSQRLLGHAQLLLEEYQSWLQSDEIKGIELDYLLLSTEDFNDFMAGRVADPSNYLGAYFPSENLAVVKFVNTQQALATSLHEISHGINFALFGQLPRFLNEGLAEYAEQSLSYTLATTLPEQELNQLRQSLKSELLDFYSLLHSEQDWHTDNNSSLYISGQAWTQFLLTSKSGKQAVGAILQQKLANPCADLSADRIIEQLAQHYPNFEQDFYYWFDDVYLNNYTP